MKIIFDEMGVKEEEELTVAIWIQMLYLAMIEGDRRVARMCLRPGRALNVKPPREAGHRRLILDYFWSHKEECDDESCMYGAVYSQVTFEDALRCHALSSKLYSPLSSHVARTLVHG